MAGPASALDAVQAVPANPPETVATDTEAPTTKDPGAPLSMPGKGMMHGGGQHGKGKGGMMHGGGGQHGKGSHGDDHELIQRLDMIEARMAKIEAMLEILVRR